MVSSNAAVATLTAPVPLLKNDSLLTLIVHLLPENQVKVSAPKKGSSISLSINEDSNVITERNAILRTLCGITLLNRLDNYPMCLLGGYSEGSKSSSEASIAIASIGSFMSIASMVRSGDEKEVDIVHQLNEVLAESSFLVGSTFKPTLADYDVFYALEEKQCLNADVITKDVPHLKRWTLAVQAAIEDILNNCTNGSVAKGVPECNSPSLEFGTTDPVPIYFYGDEENIPTPTTTSVASKASAGTNDAATNKGGAAGGAKKELSDEEKKAAADKRAKKAAEKAKKKADNAAAAGGKAKAKGNTPATELDVTALDIRVGKIVEVWEHESSDKLWCETIEFADGEKRQILSGLRQFYKKEDMQGRLILALCNLKKRNLAGVPSHGMVLCATNADHTAVEFVVPPEGAKLGERVMFGDLEGEAKPENQVAKKKILEKLSPDLKTDSNGVVVWKGISSKTSAGPCAASKGMKDAQVS